MFKAAVFEWDEAKRAQVWSRHAIDFNIAIEVFMNPLIEKSSFEGEERWIAVGVIDVREDRCHLYVSRRSDKNHKIKTV